MSKTTEPDAANQNPNHAARLFSLRDLFVLTAVFGLWLFMFSELRSDPMALAVLGSIAIGAGVVSHLLYAYVFRWRGTALVSLLVLPALSLIAVGAYFGVAGDMLWLLTLPAAFTARESWSERFAIMMPYLACAAIGGVAHPIKPSLTNAIISALGISIWYGLALLMAANAG
jgi:FtsH-binding integral membrane protein